MKIKVKERNRHTFTPGSIVKLKKDKTLILVVESAYREDEDKFSGIIIRYHDGTRGNMFKISTGMIKKNWQEFRGKVKLTFR